MIYIELFHGRKPGEELHDWGRPGPIFASPTFFHVTYACEIKFSDDVDNILTVVGGGDDTVSDCVYYDGMFYGDWSVFSQEIFDSSAELRARLTIFDQDKARVPDLPSASTMQIINTRITLLTATVWRWLAPWLI